MSFQSKCAHVVLRLCHDSVVTLSDVRWRHFYCAHSRTSATSPCRVNRICAVELLGQHPIRGHKMRIAILETDRSQAFVLQHWLMTAGHAPRRYESGGDLL